MKKIICLLIIIIGYTSTINCQFVNWYSLPNGAVNGSCVSNTDTLSGNICLAVEYTPANSGFVTSYTFSFFTNCIGSIFPSIQTESCTMVNNSNVVDSCQSLNLFQLQASGNSGYFQVQANVPEVMHQVCILLPPGENLYLEKDTVAGLTVSIESASGTPFTDEPVFIADTIESIAIFPCNNSSFCSVNFGTVQNKINFTNNVNGNLTDGSSAPNAMPGVQSFDIYNEIFQDCSAPGGLDDVSISYGLIATYDVNGNHIIDALGGDKLKIKQGPNGIEGYIPFGLNSTSETSSGDVRGYEVSVNFAPHISILADQIYVNMASMNSTGEAYESSYLVFLDENGNPYGTATYNGYYGSETDLSGQCLPTAASNPWSVTGTGVVLMDDLNTVTITDPCYIEGGVSYPDTFYINARIHAGLDSNDIVSGFKVVVRGEDIAAPTSLDDGSGTGGEDLLKANKVTTTGANLISSLLGFSIDGCVFTYNYNSCLQVLNVNDAGPGSLRSAIECAQPGDTITFHPDVFNKTINLISSDIYIAKGVTLLADLSDSIYIKGLYTDRTFILNSQNQNVLDGLHIISGSSNSGGAILNTGNSTLKDLNVYRNTLNDENGVKVLNEGNLQIKNNVTIKKE